MPITFPSLDAILTHGFDTVIDVRSPAEFAIDHVPGAINLPALDNDCLLYTSPSPRDRG